MLLISSRPFAAFKTGLCASLIFISGLPLASGQAVPHNPLPTEELEKSDDAPALLWRTGVSPRMISQHDAFISRQVNVNASGQNITGDAANEPSITVDPTNGNKITIGWRQFNSVASNFRQAGYAFTTNAGASWTFPGVLENNVFRSDPVLDADSTGTFFYLSLLETFFDNMWRSLDGGMTWTNIAPAKGGDKQWFVIDSTASIGHSFQYQHWSSSGNNFGGKQFTRSTDGGVTWLNPITLPNSASWGTPDVDSNGTLYIGGVNLGTGQIWCERSTNAKDGSVTPTFDLSTKVNLGGDIGFSYPINPVGLVGQIFLACDRSGTATNNNVYMMASVIPTGSNTGSDVMFVRSTDGGATFSAPVRVNDDPINHSKWHWFGTMSVAPNGRIDSVWLDSRNAANNTDSQLFYSYSTDAGATWAPNVSVSGSFNPFLGYPNQSKMGDYITIVSDNAGGDVAYAATFNGEEDVYYVRVAPAATTFAFLSADSIKGGFPIDLPLTGAPGIEDRSGGSKGRFTVEFVFNNELASVGSVTTSCGIVENSMIDSGDAHRYIVNLRNVTCNADDVTVTLNNVVDGTSNTILFSQAVMGLLLGDVDGDGSVTSADFSIEKADQGQTTDGTNFRADIDASGTIDRRDATTVKRQIGTSLP
ncbi:MAG TPA: dockerin type I domain-containing protein [Chthoniobacterales bacterium]|nr:dockerin type I domain-containing protein [Chthoniobacterales bacterium]